MNHPHEDWLKQRLGAAEDTLSEAIKAYNQTQVDTAKDRTQYFEKLTIGCGAAIAALVSFLGATSDKHPLQPKWLLHYTLLALVLAMFAALWRNWRYQNYLLMMAKKVWGQSQYEEQQRRNEFFQVATVSGWQTGKRINLDEWNPQFQTMQAGLEKKLAKLARQEKLHLKEIAVAGNSCLVSIFLAMVALVVIAFKNF
jgi:hypothetical protein